MDEKYSAHKLFMGFSDAVTLGLGIAIGTFMAYITIALAAGFIVLIVYAVSR